MQAIHARRAVAVIFFSLGSYIGVWASRIPDIKDLLQLNDADFGLLLLVMATGAFVSFPVAGRMIDRIGASLVSKGFAIATLLFFASVSAGTTVPVMVPLVFLTGFGIGALDVAMNGWGAEVEKELRRPVMSSYHGLFSLGAGAGAGAGAIALWLELSVPQHFLMWCALMAIPLTWAIRIPWVSERQGASEEKAPLLAIPKGGLLFAGIMALAAALAEGAVTDWAALYQIQELGYEPSEAAVGFAVFSVAMVVMRFAGDGVIARFGAVPVARTSGIAAVIGALLLVVGSHIWVIWIGCAIMGVGNAVIFPLAMSRAAADPVMSKGTALAAVATLGYGAFLLGPPVLGFVGHVVSLRAAFGIVAACGFLIILLAGSLKVRN